MAAREARVKPPVFLILCQVYPPDPTSVGQHVADVAVEMVRRGYRVVVYTSARGYDDPTCIYPSRELRDGVDVRRLPLSSFGKSSIRVRLLGQFLFLAQAVLRGVCTRGTCAVLVSTSPPLCGLAGALLGALRRVPVKYWVMDLNPDELVAMGLLRPEAWPVRLVDWCNRRILRAARDIVVLDRFMRARVCRKLDVEAKIATIPPWSHVPAGGEVPRAENPFVREHVPPGAFVVMYSGNHSHVNPIRTLLDAAAQLQDDPRLLVLCVGGGQGKREVEERIARGAPNLRSLPYQPFDQIRFSLAAADVHVVSLGEAFAGIVHPCKIYGAMAAGRPILYLGPAPSHVSELLEAHRIGWHVRHGDVEGMVRALREMLALPAEERQAMGRRAAAALADALAPQRLLAQFCDVMERGLPPPAV
jgi:glycosyltransferase involved in cell wall biosynthesis